MAAQPVLYMMLGYPGAGKTTAAKIIAEISGAEHLASDFIRLELFPKPQFTEEEHRQLYAYIDKLAERLLLSGKSVIYDANLNRFEHRDQKYSICRRSRARSVLVWVQTPKELAKRRATKLSENDPLRPFGNFDEPTFDRLAMAIEPPGQDEPHIMLDGTKITTDYVRAALGI